MVSIINLERMYLVIKLTLYFVNMIICKYLKLSRVIPSILIEFSISSIQVVSV